MALFRKIIWHSAKFDIWWPLVTSILTWAKKCRKYFRRYSLRAIERFFPCLSIPLSFWVRKCGHFDPLSPPPGQRWLRPPPGCRLRDPYEIFSDLSFIWALVPTKHLPQNVGFSDRESGQFCDLTIAQWWIWRFSANKVEWRKFLFPQFSNSNTFRIGRIFPGKAIIFHRKCILVSQFAVKVDEFLRLQFESANGRNMDCRTVQK